MDAIADFIEENWVAFVSKIENNYGIKDAEAYAEEILAKLKEQI